MPMTTARSLVTDLALAAGLVVFGVLGTAGASADSAGPLVDRPIDAVGYALVIGAAAVLVTRRRWPLGTLGVAAVVTALYLGLGFTYGPILFSFFVAVYTAARYRPVERSLPVAAVALGLLLTHLFTNPAALPGLLGVFPAAAWVVVPFAVGASVKVIRDARERERDQAERRRVDSERLRVAEEVHDIVGHGLAAIRLQADVALHVLAKRPEQAQVALDAISRTSGEALEELRATLGVIRKQDPADEFAHGPRLARLDDLQRRMADAGARIELETVGVPRALPAAVDLAGYRIVQESLTNVLRHSPVREARVVLSYDEDAFGISVSNRAPGSPRPGDGLGIAGMRRRVTSLGGDFAAGPTIDERFEVRARIPTNGHR